MTTIPAAHRTPFIETFPTRRWKGHAALVWIAGRVYAAFFGPTLTAVIEAARAYVAASRRGVE